MTTTDLEYNSPIPDGEFVVRFCRKYTWKVKRDGTYNIRAKAFRSGRSPANDISVNWLGHFKGDESFCLNRVCETTTYCGINGCGIFVRLDTTSIRKIYIESLNESLITRYRPEEDGKNPSHAEICPGGDAVFKALALHANKCGVVLEVPDAHK